MAGNNENIKQLVARLKDIHERTGMNFPAWMMDEKRSGDHELTAAEQHEWAEIICKHMRGTVALTYLIECEKRWGLRDGEYQFKTGEFVFGLTRQLIENLLIEHVEGALLEQKPQERYLAVFQFYSANDQRLKEDGHSWFSGFLDEMFMDLAVRLRVGEAIPVQHILH
ncbi:TPA: hypothetical protein ACTYL1_004390 [Citrobacter freundii]|uniref:hypothetical protein n=1 Tax=Citrobacter freundii complex TaxID=1344959 RepID=UPI000CDCB50A|nr:MULTISPECIES: hypothetical protein [Citrobacter freundii complex]AUZ69950.1 hypothetical protein C2U41_11655 [Citrobacter freundii complex sp. CFNIH4]POU15692.1 hypothetical protein C3368_01425 [Citrobacter freundii complex sp. CFNIH7]POU17280.1 hypothetical protein C3381_06730 [Citrobacter freundii complex sp. CFNIH6]QLR82405.1 hypothetical protein HV333_10940 [Citrobacter freundii]WOU42778.1 hypothetical protein R4T15_14705 [Citrobacter portucalensis]